jgi:hypothetical protein
VSLLYHGFGVVTSTLHSACEVAAPTPSTFASIKRLWLPDPSVWLCNVRCRGGSRVRIGRHFCMGLQVYQASVPFLLSAFVAMNAILLAVAPWMIQLPVLSASLTGLVWLLAPHVRVSRCDSCVFRRGLILFVVCCACLVAPADFLCSRQRAPVAPGSVGRPVRVRMGLLAQAGAVRTHTRLDDCSLSWCVGGSYRGAGVVRGSVGIFRVR